VRVSLCGLLLLFTSCTPRGPVQHYDVVNAKAEPLRSAFNADSGAVRAIYLASPT
jgi:hypothetical protein